MFEPPPLERAPGWALARFDASGLDEVGVFGRADLEAGTPVRPDTRFRWFSITKIVTALATLRLVDDGRLRLSDAVSRYLPYFQPRPSRPVVTIHHLLCHSSGLWDPSARRWARPPGAALRSPEEVTRAALAERGRLRSAPGSAGRYTNLGYLLLGEVIAARAREPYRAFVRRAILEPLGMSRTDFVPGEMAIGHARLKSLHTAALALSIPESAELVRYVRGGFIGLAPFLLEGEAYGGLVGSVEDLASLGRFLLGDGTSEGRRVLDARWLDAIFTPRASGRAEAYGLGVVVDGPRVGHAGRAGGFAADLWIDLPRRRGLAVLANAGDAPADIGSDTIT